MVVILKSEINITSKDKINHSNRFIMLKLVRKDTSFDLVAHLVLEI